ncbi:MAG: porin [Nitrosomonadales bacterium]|nr:porin [Nitrosomonadales bacterium]
MNKGNLLSSLIIAALAIPGAALAADAPAAPAAPTLSAILDASGISLSGDIDFSYSSLSGTGQFATGGFNNRVFDYAHNSFTMQAMDLTIAKTPAEGYGGAVNVTMGKDASTIASYGAGVANQTFDLTQAYVQYAAGSWTTIAGKFITQAGQEYIKSSANTNFSRSILFGYAIPFTHTGLRTTYKASDAVSVMGGVNNGWDEANDQHPNKNIELGLMLTPTKTIVFNVMDHYGTEQIVNGSATQGNRNLLDLVLTYAVTDSLNFALNYDGGSQDNAPLANGSTGSAKWSGLAAYANYQINDPWRISVRIESFNDTDGYRTGVVQTWKEATLTVGYAPSKSVELRGEVRQDKSDKASFAYNDTIARDSQSSLGLEAIYKF